MTTPREALSDLLGEALEVAAGLADIVSDYAADGAQIPLTLARAQRANFDTNQPRIPAGNPEGGQWDNELDLMADLAMYLEAGALPGTDSPELRGEAKRIMQVLVDQLESQGITREQILFGGDGYNFSVGDDKFKAAAHYNPADDKITMFWGSLASEPKALGILAHETNHLMRDAVMKEYARETKELLALDSSHDVIYPDGQLKEAYQERYPIYQMLAYYHTGWIADRLEKNDGVSEYSKSYWTAFAKGQGRWDTAISETLAEIARLYYEGNQKGIYVSWKGYYIALTRAWKLIQKRKKKGRALRLVDNTPVIVYLNDKWEPVERADATLAKLMYPDGNVIFAEPIDTRQNARLITDTLYPDGLQRAIPDARGYATVRREHHDSIYAAVVGYLDTSLPVTSYRNLAGRAILSHFPEAFYGGYAESSDVDSVAEEDDKWLTEQMNRAVGYVDDLFERLKDVRKEGGYDAEAEAQARADSYCITLDSVNGQGRLRGNLNLMLTFDGPDGENTCKQCQRYKGQSHRARWWLQRDLVRRNGNENFDCGRWDNCHHHLYRKNGELWTV